MKVKICGITHPDDAEYAARLGAEYIGMIFCEHSKRHVSIPLAKAIADTAKQMGAEPVGVFVEQTYDQIRSLCAQTGIHTIQLHGSMARKSLYALIDTYSVIYSISVEEKGSISEAPALPPSVMPLYDNLNGGTGNHFDWRSFARPHDTKWLLAGGLTPGNVREAIALLKPYGVDIATGVESPGTTRKDPILVKTFIEEATQ